MCALRNGHKEEEGVFLFITWSQARCMDICFPLFILGALSIYYIVGRLAVASGLEKNFTTKYPFFFIRYDVCILRVEHNILLQSSKNFNVQCP
jgi:hypothetical protein